MVEDTYCLNCYWIKGYPAKYISLDINKLDIEKKRIDFLKEKPRSLIIFGATGTGKTTLVLAYMLHHKINYNCFYNVNKLVEEVKNNELARVEDKRDVFEIIANKEHLILDDLIKLTEYGMQVMYNIINYRYERELPVVLITNLDRKMQEQVLGQRVFSRLVEMCYFLVKDGKDYRKDKIKEI